ncbi:MAG: SIMPL domain-containing protein [Mycobacterium sp.]|nr:SIMPL domain-containing protein [Mycobacterium sp.]
MLTPRIAALLIAPVAAAALAGCDSAPPAQSGARQVTVVGSGKVQGTPDTVTADVGIEVVAPDATAAMNQASDRQKAVIDALTGRGFDAKDIRTTTLTVQPQLGDNAVVTGYRATNDISVTMRELDAAPETLATVVNIGGNAARINSVTFSIENDSQMVSDARAKAFEDAKDRAQQYADLSGLALGKILSISEAPEANPPRPMPAPPGAMAAAVPLQPGEQTVSFAVTAIWELN